MALVAKFLEPAIPPQEEYSPESDVIAWRKLNDGEAFLEIFRRTAGSYGFRYKAWVAWRDAGNEVRSHSWHTIDSKTSLVTDGVSQAQEVADAAAIETGSRTTGEWIYAV